jgi:Rrf2 family transcriptional regulator, nitric oxide-sensitive transcriptional repressor
MRISLYTDFSLRLLVYLASRPDARPVGAGRIAADFKVSAHHMQKVAQKLRKLGYVTSKSGRDGGLTLARAPGEIRIGDVVEALEGMGKIADCNRGPCLFFGACALKGALDRAERGFINELRGYTLTDVVRGPMRLKLAELSLAA